MNRKIIIFLTALLLFLLIICNTIVYATDDETLTSKEEILSSQQESLNISSFIKETKKYTQDTFEDLDMGEIFSSAISGNIDNETLLKAISNVVRKRSNRLHYCTRKYSCNNYST